MKTEEAKKNIQETLSKLEPCFFVSASGSIQFNYRDYFCVRNTSNIIQSTSNII